MIIDDEQKRVHWRRTQRLMWAGLGLLSILIVLAPHLAPLVESYVFLRFPMGFFLLAHGIVIGIVLVVYWFISAQEKADSDTNIFTQV